MYEELIPLIYFCRRQLCVCAQTIAREDYPYNWPGIMDQIHTTLSTESQASAWLGSLLVLHQVLQAMGLSSSGYSVGILWVIWGYFVFFLNCSVSILIHILYS